MLQFFRTLSIAKKLWLLVATFSVVVLGDNLVESAQHSQRLRSEKELQLAQLVDSAHSVLAHYQRQAQAGHLSEAGAKQQAIAALRGLRYSEREYFWIHDVSLPTPHMVMHPTSPHLEGVPLADPRFGRATSLRSGRAGPYQPLHNANIFVAMNEALAATGEGYVTYDWNKPLVGGGVTSELYPKLSYVKRFDPWGWVVGSGIYIDDLDAVFWRDMELRILKGGLWLLLLAIIVWALTRTIVQPLRLFQATIDTLRANPDTALRLPHEQPDELGRLTGSFETLINDLQHSRGELNASVEKLNLAGCAFANMSEGVIITDPEGRILSVNPAFCRISGYTSEQVLGRKPSLLQSGQYDRAFYQAMWGRLTESGHWSGEIWNRSRDGRIYPEWLSISASCDADGKVRHYVGVFSDISERKRAESQIRHLAEHDALTELPNRVLLLDRLEQALHKAQRSGTLVGLLFIDLDHFKNINDTLGHEIGDELLRHVSQRIQLALRASDTISRTGGDEFTVLLPDLNEPGDSERVTQTILASLARPVWLSDHEIVVSASIGISIYPGDGETAQRLIQCADIAMYHSKDHGRNTYSFYTSDMNVRVSERMLLEHRMRQALERGEFVLHYQPQVSAADGEIRGLEALARWQHPEIGMISPARFIPVAEDSGLILRLGDWVLREACRQMRQWFDAGLPRMTIAVNISAIQFREANFVASVRAALRDTGLPPELLELEITESVMMNHVEQTMGCLRELKDIGVRFSIDDFGTGYSSLTYLKRFPIDKLKIDQSFVRGVVVDPQDASIVRTIIALADSLNLTTIAEGVESAEVCDALFDLGCGEIQGYLFARPQGAAEIEDLIRRWDGGRTEDSRESQSA
jgi:diguanylate cyclase (GGDEF)-like protein/PAS domain S-box-containing protein